MYFVRVLCVCVDKMLCAMCFMTVLVLMRQSCLRAVCKRIEEVLQIDVDENFP